MPAHRKPLSVLSLNGSLKKNPGRFSDRAETASCPDGIGEPPKHLSIARKNIWRELVAHVPEGHLQSADRFLLEILTGLVAQQRNRKTLITKGEQSLLMQALSKLGLTPVDRNRVTVVPKPVVEPSPWDDL